MRRLVYSPLPPEISGIPIPDPETPSAVDLVVTSVNNVAWLAPGAFSYGTHATWEDASLYSNHFTSSGDQRPTAIASGVDGNPGVRFDGVSQQLARILRGIPAGSKPCVLLVGAADDDDPVTSGTAFMSTGVSELEFGIDVEWTKTGAVRTNTRLGPSATASVATGAGLADSEAHWLLSVVANASNRAEIYFDGDLKATAAGGAAGGLYETSTHAWIGGTLGFIESDPTNRWWKGDMYEVLIFDGVPTPSEFTNLFADVLAPRWPSLDWSFS